MIHKFFKTISSPMSRACCAVLLVVTLGFLQESHGEDLFAAPEPVETPAELPAVETIHNEYRPLPPIGDIAGHRSSILPRWTYSPLQSPLFLEFPAVTRPIFGPPLLNRGTQCQPAPGYCPPPSAPGYMRGPTRYGITSPVAPAVVSAHAPPWEQLPTPAELNGGILKVGEQCHDPRSCEAQFNSGDFSPGPFYGQFGWDSCGELAIYGGKHMNPIQRPAIEWGLPFYETGPLPRSGTAFGCTNLVQQKFYVYGDYRSALAYNQNIGNEQTIWANRLNLEFDWAITATERIHMFMGPLDERNEFNSIIYDDGEIFTNDAWDFWDQRTDTLFFEGDLGYIIGGFTDQYASFNLPFALGLMPLLFQNGIWMEDAFLGVAATIPARNNPVLDWSNFDTTLFIGLDEVTSNIAFEGDNRAANVVGFTTFIERRGGYIEAGYAFLDDTENQGRSYHNIGASYTRRYANLVSNSLRMIVNTGQDGPSEQRTADGLLLLMENSFLTRNPYNVIPYANFFAGFGHPQSVARLQGPLKNTGINFESDLLTGYPTLDSTGNNTFGGAVGIDLLGNCFEQQLILEAATVQVMNSPADRVAQGDQYAVGLRFQKPLSHTLIFRTDAMYGILKDSPDIAGARVELRRKF
ncbi:hypothetical protein [Bythopirellula polymerisocia]|nr:hypothetical protein [Bythopirellula polymerisocia]